MWCPELLAHAYEEFNTPFGHYKGLSYTRAPPPRPTSKSGTNDSKADGHPVRPSPIWLIGPEICPSLTPCSSAPSGSSVGVVIAAAILGRCPQPGAMPLTTSLSLPRPCQASEKKTAGRAARRGGGLGPEERCRNWASAGTT